MWLWYYVLYWGERIMAERIISYPVSCRGMAGDCVGKKSRPSGTWMGNLRIGLMFPLPTPSPTTTPPPLPVRCLPGRDALSLFTRMLGVRYKNISAVISQIFKKSVSISVVYPLLMTYRVLCSACSSARFPVLPPRLSSLFPRSLFLSALGYRSIKQMVLFRM